MRVLELECDGWACGGVAYPVTFAERLRGLVGRSESAMLIRGRSVHGVGMRRPLRVVGIAADGTVLGVETLRPGRVVFWTRASWVLELDTGLAAPAPGSVIGPLPVQVRRVTRPEPPVRVGRTPSGFVTSSLPSKLGWVAAGDRRATSDD